MRSYFEFSEVGEVVECERVQTKGTDHQYIDYFIITSETGRIAGMAMAYFENDKLTDIRVYLNKCPKKLFNTVKRQVSQRLKKLLLEEIESFSS